MLLYCIAQIVLALDISVLSVDYFITLTYPITAV